MMILPRKVKVSQSFFAAARFNQFLAIWSEYGFGYLSYNNDPHICVLC